ncbi:MAG: DUF1887 family CARF protein [Pseudomonadota bacterium]
MIFNCERCDTRIECADEHAGLSICCPACGAELTAPTPSAFGPGAVVPVEVLDFDGDVALVSLPGGQPGVLPRDEISWTIDLPRPADRLQVGQTVTVLVTGADERGRLVVSQRRADLAEDPWEGLIPARLRPGQRVKATVRGLRTNKGGHVRVVLDLDPGLIGYELRAGTTVTGEPGLDRGQVCEVVVEDLLAAERRIVISIPGTQPADGRDEPHPRGIAPTPALPAPGTHRPPPAGLVLLAGPASFLAMLTSQRAFDPQALAFDPLASAQAFNQFSRDHAGIRTVFVHQADTAEHMVAQYGTALASAQGGAAVVVTDEANREQTLGAMLAARRGGVPLFFLVHGDPGVLMDAESMAVAFRTSIDLGIEDLLGLRPGVTLVSSSLLPSGGRARRVLLGCRALAEHCECDWRILATLRERYEQRARMDRPVWFCEDRPGEAHTRRLLSELERGGIVTRSFESRNVANSWGAQLEDADDIARLFEQGLWLEYAAADAVGRITGVTDVRLRAQLLIGDAQREIDVMASTGSQLLLLECKTGGWNSADLTKLAGVRDALGAEAWLVATRSQMLSDLAESSRRYGLHLISATALVEDPQQILRPEAQPLAPAAPSPRRNEVARPHRGASSALAPGVAW